MSKYPFLKVDLHFHLDGSMVPETTWRLAKERNVTLPASTLDEFKDFLVRTADCGDVGEYLARFDIPTAILQDKQALIETTYDTIKNVKDSLCYCEIRFAPQLHTLKGLTQQDAIEAVLEGKKKAEADFPQIKVGLIFCCMISLQDNSKANDRKIVSKILWSSPCSGPWFSRFWRLSTNGTLPLFIWRAKKTAFANDYSCRR